MLKMSAITSVHSPLRPILELNFVGATSSQDIQDLFGVNPTGELIK